jgi:hypothetical protein
MTCCEYTKGTEPTRLIISPSDCAAKGSDWQSRPGDYIDNGQCDWPWKPILTCVDYDEDGNACLIDCDDADAEATTEEAATLSPCGGGENPSGGTSNNTGA